MSNTHLGEALRSLKNKALELAAQRHKLLHPQVIDTASGFMRSTQEPVHRFRIVSASEGNGPACEIVLSESGSEVEFEKMSEHERAAHFPHVFAATLPVHPATATVTIDPTDNKFDLKQGDTFAETITVTIPGTAAGTKADVYFLADTTGSMGGILGAVQAGAGNILTTLNGLGLDIQYGVGNYKDFPISVPDGDPYAFQHQQNPTNVAADVQTAINTWSADGGVDTPEAGIFALHKLAENPGGPIGWRTGSKRVVVWFGDAPGHDPICPKISGEAAAVTEISATAELVAQGITVLAISTSTPGLDDDPKAGESNYDPFCGPPGGKPGQGTRIATATGGKFVSPVNAANIAATIIDLVKGAVGSIKNVSLVPAGAIVPCVTSISPAGGYGPLAGDVTSPLKFDVKFTGNVACKDTAQVFTGTLDVVADGKVIVRKPVQITVPACPKLFSYAVKFVCGAQRECDCACSSVRPGAYATEINIYNQNLEEVTVLRLITPLVLAGAPVGREPATSKARVPEIIRMPALTAMMEDCCRIAELLLGAPPEGQIPITIGFVELVSTVELSVTAVYTATNLTSGSIAIDVQQIEPKLIRTPRMSAVMGGKP